MRSSQRNPIVSRIVLLSLVLLGPMWLHTSLAAGRWQAPPPNFVVILTDDMDFQSLAVMPNVATLLAAQGASFSRFFVTTPLCCPSRASILRGQYAHNHGVLTNAGRDGGFPAFRKLGDETSTAATWLQGAGYRTGIFGKYLNGYPKGVDPTYVAPGWNDWRVGIDYAAYFGSNYDLNENGALFHYGEEESAYLTDLLSRQTADFIQGAVGAGQPFFAYVSTFAPHGPAIPAPRHAAAFADATAPRLPSFNEADVSDKPAWVGELPLLDDQQIGLLDVRYRDRSRSLLAVDELVAEVMRTLEATGALANTYIFFLSDNGFHQGEHRLPAGKQTPYEESIRVPLIVRGPGVPVGVTVDHIALNIDLAPTLADFAGIAAPEFVDGRSLRPLLTAEGSGAASWRQSFLLELFVPTKERERARTDATADQSTAETDGESEGGVAAPPPYAGLRTADLLYVEYETGEREFYDLRVDPYEMDNSAASADPAVIDALAARLAELRGCVAAACRAAEEAAVASATPA